MTEQAKPGLVDAKLDCEFSFMSKDARRLLIGPYPAVVHLFEHSYGKFRFVYGVADVLVTALQMNHDAEKMGMPPDKGFQWHPGAFDYQIKATDGMIRLATWVDSESEWTQSGNHFLIAFLVTTPKGPSAKPLVPS